jgi:hypothetical protein
MCGGSRSVLPEPVLNRPAELRQAQGSLSASTIARQPPQRRRAARLLDESAPDRVVPWQTPAARTASSGGRRSMSPTWRWTGLTSPRTSAALQPGMHPAWSHGGTSEGREPVRVLVSARSGEGSRAFVAGWGGLPGPAPCWRGRAARACGVAVGLMVTRAVSALGVGCSLPAVGNGDPRSRESSSTRHCPNAWRSAASVAATL